MVPIIHNFTKPTGCRRIFNGTKSFIIYDADEFICELNNSVHAFIPYFYASNFHLTPSDIQFRDFVSKTQSNNYLPRLWSFIHRGIPTQRQIIVIWENMNVSKLERSVKPDGLSGTLQLCAG